jgi:copper transporter 1
MGREYDAFILRRARLRQMYLSGSTSMASAKQAKKKGAAPKVNGRECPCDCPQNDDPINTAPGMESSNTKLAGSNDATPVAADGVHSVNGDVARDKNPDTLPPYRPSPIEQGIRALFHMVQFAVAYFIMLLAMYYNGYIIICIFIGAFLGALIFSWEPLSLSKE